MLTQQFKYSGSHSPMHREKYYLFRNNNLHSSVRHKQLFKCSNSVIAHNIHIMAVYIYNNMAYNIIITICNIHDRKTKCSRLTMSNNAVMNSQCSDVKSLSKLFNV